MKKKLVIILFTIVVTSAFSQKRKRLNINTIKHTTDSIVQENKKIREEFHAISKKINEISKNNFDLNKFNNSLEKDLLYFKSKEDFYKTALSEQTKFYILTVTILLFLIGFISWKGIMFEIK
ncbi:hypothetical protein [Tenacibaculum halocynthiae]|uniref:hypothetical protein n=1 Tax=Tenacibaculum halocynthiae TaxID=1254437 RepID=UPI003D64AB05